MCNLVTSKLVSKSGMNGIYQEFFSQFLYQLTLLKICVPNCIIYTNCNHKMIKD